MSEVSCRVCEPVLDAVLARGGRAEELVAGLSFSVEDLRIASGRVAWDDYTLFLERAARALGGPAALERLGAEHRGDPAVGLLKLLAQRFGTRPAYQMGAKWYGPSLFSCTRASCEDLPEGRIRQVVEILPPHRHSPEFFEMMGGFLRATPAMLGLPHAAVEMEVSPRRAVYTITPPKSVALAERVQQFFRWRGGSQQQVIGELVFQQQQLSDALDRARRQSERLRREMNERRRTQEQLQQVQKMEAVGRLAGGLAHDLNNTLTAIGSYAELARDALPQGSPAAADIDEIMAEGERAAGLIKQLLAFSRRQMRLPERVDVSRSVLGMERMLGRLLGERFDLQVKVAGDLGAVLVDPGQLEQIIVNLVTNSRDAMPSGGAITIATANVEREDGKRFVQLEVRDEGLGMDDETRSRIFEPFFTTKPRGQGTGLGLSAVYGIVAQSGGRIDIESAPGRGTAIRVELPRVEAAEEGSRTSEGEPPGGEETLLLVEDEASVRSTTRRILEGRGYRVLEAGDGEAALRLSRDFPDDIALLLTDVVMPGVDGRELAEQLTALRPEMRGVVYISGHATDDVASQGQQPGERAFLRKPFSPPALLRSVRAVLDAAAPGA